MLQKRSIDDNLRQLVLMRQDRVYPRNNRAYTNKVEIADQFNKHFVNVGQNLAKRIENCDGSPTQFIRSTPVASFVMSCFTETQVCS